MHKIGYNEQSRYYRRNVCQNDSKGCNDQGLSISRTCNHHLSNIQNDGTRRNGLNFGKKNGVTSGIITDRDFAIKITANKISIDTPVETIASFPLQTIKLNESILAAAKIMSNKKIRKLVVVDEGKIVGIITSTDLVNKLSSRQ